MQILSCSELEEIKQEKSAPIFGNHDQYLLIIIQLNRTKLLKTTRMVFEWERATWWMWLALRRNKIMLILIQYNLKTFKAIHEIKFYYYLHLTSLPGFVKEIQNSRLLVPLHHCWNTCVNEKMLQFFKEKFS